jgi:hypothetical protein
VTPHGCEMGAEVHMGIVEQVTRVAVAFATPARFVAQSAIRVRRECAGNV